MKSKRNLEEDKEGFQNMNCVNKPRVVVIVGPTASGKTSASIEIAKKLNGEIVSADSMQIYEEMNIGTAKPTEDEKEGIKHYLIGIAKPDENFNVTMYKELAEKAIEEILAKGKLPIVVGGTGLYVSSLVDAIEFSEVPEDGAYRHELEEVAKTQGVDVLFEKLQKVDPEAAQKIEKNNVRRVIRALEIYKTTGKTKTQLDQESLKEPKYEYHLYGISWERDVLYQRIDKRVDMMMEEGLVDEVKRLNEKYTLSKTALQGIGYKEVLCYLQGECNYEEMVEKIKMETRRYAKRQLTWFRRDKRIMWYPSAEIVSHVIQDFT